MTDDSGMPLPPMSAEAVLRTLAEDQPDARADALASADAHREVLVDRLLDALERGLADPLGASPEDASLFSYALYLLAKWREPRAYPHVIRWLSLPEEEPFDIAGDVVTQDGGRILAAVCDGNLEPITALIVNQQADEWGRSAGAAALTLLAAWGDIPRQVVIDRLMWLVQEGLERESSIVWSELAVESVDIEALEIFPDLRRAYDDGLIDSQVIGRTELDEVEAMPRGEMVRRTREHRPPIVDVWAATAWWDRRPRDGDADDDRSPYGDDDDWAAGGDDYVEVTEPYRAPPKVGRNAPCPCGSGKKYKKCCGR